MNGVRRLVGTWPLLRGPVSDSEVGRATETYADRMLTAVGKVRTAELQVGQATTLDELDLGRCALQQAHAEIQHLIRSAKRELGIPVRDIGESEAMYLRLMRKLNRRPAQVEGENGLADTH